MNASRLLPILPLVPALLSTDLHAHPGHGPHGDAIQAITHQTSTLDLAIVGLTLYFLGGSLFRLTKAALTVRRPVDE